MGNRKWLSGEEARHKGKDTFRKNEIKVFPIFLFHTGIQSMAIGEPYKKIIWFITYHTHGLFNCHGKGEMEENNE